MSIAATVENGTIKLPEGIHLPDGTRVEIVLPQEEPEAARESPLAWMAEFAGRIRTLPPDAAARHTEYAHGRKRRFR